MIVAEIKERHPSWFKMKLERRELVRQLSPETAVNVLLACWDYLETGEKPAGLSPIEGVAFSAFIPDMDEAWSRYIVRISAGAKGGRPKKPYGSICPHTVPYGTEEDVEEESIFSKENIERVADKPPKRSRFTPPSTDEVRAYCKERKNGVDPALFVDFYTARGWRVGKGKMKDWRAAVRTWERRSAADTQSPPPSTPLRLVVDENGEEVATVDN